MAVPGTLCLLPRLLEILIESARGAEPHTNRDTSTGLHSRAPFDFMQSVVKTPFHRKSEPFHY